MANEIFDRETLLDLTVNFIPLFMILFFVVVYLLFDPWGYDPLMTVLMVGLHAVPFVALAFLTYISGRAIAGAEKGQTVFPQGRATVPSAGPLSEVHDEGIEESTADGSTADESTTEDGGTETESGAETGTRTDAE